MTLLLASEVPSAVPVMSPPLEAMVKSVGSINQVPLRPPRPGAAKVLMAMLSPKRTLLALVSMKPPSPPASPPLAEMLPLTSVTLAALAKSAISVTVPPLPALAASAVMVPLWLILFDARSMIRPPSFTSPLACITPLLLTTPPCTRSSACADKMMSPPGACTARPLSTRLAMVEAVTSSPVSAFAPSMCRVKVSPAAIATVPSLATTTPWLRTVGASKAM